MTTPRAQPIPPDQLNAARAAYLAEAREGAEASMVLVAYVLLSAFVAVVFTVFLALWWVILK